MAESPPSADVGWSMSYRRFSPSAGYQLRKPPLSVGCDSVTNLGRRQSTSSSSSLSSSLRNLAIQESQRNHASDNEKLTKFILLVLVLLLLLMYYLRLEVEEVIDLMYSCKVQPET